MIKNKIMMYEEVKLVTNQVNQKSNNLSTEKDMEGDDDNFTQMMREENQEKKKGKDKKNQKNKLRKIVKVRK